MNNPGVYPLVVMQVTAALSAVAQSPIDDLDGALGASIEAAWAYGTGGTSLSAIVQTTFDGSVWRDVARFDFVTASRVAMANLSGLTAKNVATYVALASEGVNDGILGSQFRVLLTSVGVFVNSTLSVRLSVR